MRQISLTSERLRELLSYDSETGIFVRIKCVNNKAPAGEIAGTIDRYGYRLITLDWERFFAHRLAWFYVYGVWPQIHLDHINGISDDNRIANLRLSTHKQNAGNAKRHVDNTSGFKGVSFHKGTQRWQATIRSNGKTYFLGLFDTPEEAHAAYCEAAVRLHGEFARFA